jgi:hypothetical protein
VSGTCTHTGSRDGYCVMSAFVCMGGPVCWEPDDWGPKKEEESMVNKPKRIGREGENAVAARLRERGAFPDAEPRALFGINDKGDITGTPGVVFQVKSGKAAEQASPAQIRAWLEDTDKQRENARASVGVLVTKRAGYGAKRTGQWRSFLWLSDLARLTRSNECLVVHDVMGLDDSDLGMSVVELEFDTTISLLQLKGVAKTPADTFN